jgi:acyl-CoA synthetase (AMP-forming)/AMP-acid ligase II
MTDRRGVAPVYGDDDRLAALIGAGGPFEVEEIVVDGVPLRSFVRAPRSVVDIFAMGSQHDERVHVVYEGERHTLGDIRDRALRLARRLGESFGVAPGDRVGIAMRNLPEFFSSFWGAVTAGAVVVPLNAWWTGPELAYAVGDAGLKVLVADEERLERMASIPETTRPGLIAVRTERPDRFGAVDWDEVCAGDPLADSDLAVPGPDDPVTILYTSGTTGRPKGALGTHRAAVANLMNMAFSAARESLLAGRPARPPVQPVTLAAAPLFHVGGIASIIGGPMSGSKVVLMRRWDVDAGLALAEAEGATGLGGVPAIARQILYHPGVERLGLDIRTFPLGGASVPPDLPLRAHEVFGDPVQIFNGYGSTETTSAVVVNFGREYLDRPASVGRPNLTADLRVLGPEGRDVPDGEVGELCIRSPQVVKGYWNRPEDTRASFAGGWFHTGDLGFVDADGFVYVVDRLKDVVIRGGENVYSAEVEAVLHEHPAVAEAAVVGLPDESLGERVCAVIVPTGGEPVTLEQIRAFAAARLAGFKCPEALYLADELPRTATGKVEKKELRSTVASTAASSPRTLQRSY